MPPEVAVDSQEIFDAAPACKDGVCYIYATNKDHMQFHFISYFLFKNDPRKLREQKVPWKPRSKRIMLRILNPPGPLEWYTCIYAAVKTAFTLPVLTNFNLFSGFICEYIHNRYMSYILHIKVESSASNLLLTRGEWERYEMENLDTGLVTDWDEEWEEGNKEWCAEPARPTVDISDDSPEKVSYCDQEVPMAKEDVPVAMPPVASGGTTAPCADNASPIPKDDDSFVLTMLQDPDLPCDPDMALKVYRFLQGKAGSQLTEALKNSGEHAQPPMPKEPQMPSSHGKSGDNPPSSTTPQRIEKYYEDWNSSQSVTSAGSVWESPEEEMEEKIARVAPKDAKAVALYHEINKEKNWEGQHILRGWIRSPKLENMHTTLGTLLVGPQTMTSSGVQLQNQGVLLSWPFLARRIQNWM